MALGETGDKTQLLALMLAAKFRRPIPIIAGIVVATALNHAFAGAAGAWVAAALGLAVLRWVVGVSFLAMAAWTLVPNKVDGEDAGGVARFGVFGTTLLAFFVAEMGDKTQIATVALAAHYRNMFAVVGGTTLGMLLADVLAVLLGDTVAKRLPMRLVRQSPRRSLRRSASLRCRVSVRPGELRVDASPRAMSPRNCCLG